MNLTNFAIKFIFGFSLIFFFVACSQKEAKFNLAPQVWYDLILSDIKDQKLEDADKHYTSMQSEHIASPLLEPILLILAQSHLENDEFELTNLYLNEYIKRFGNHKNAEFADFLKIKTNFLSFKKPNRNQKLMLDTKNKIEKFIYTYPNSMYLAQINTMLIKFNLAIYYLNEEIYGLYSRTNQEKSAQIYRKLLDESPLKNVKFKKPTLPWYQAIFE